jgi:protein-S-isoprenylcysteine O-methyltransferase Ste14
MENIAFRFTLLCWGIFYAYWIISAFVTKRTARRESATSALTYRLPAILAFVLLFNAHKLPAPLGTVVLPSQDWLSLSAMAVSLSGLIVCIWARVTLGQNWSSVVVVKVDHELIQHGPYKFVRHPIYTGMLLLFLASVLLSSRVGAFIGLALLTFSFVLKLRQEEKVMLTVFPAQYPEYMKKVKRLVPFVY